MRYKFVLLTAAVLNFLSYSSSILAANNNILAAELCSNCHKNEPGLVIGLLKNINFEARGIEIDLASHPDLIKYNDDTALKNLGSFYDISNYLDRGFKIKFSEVDGERIATDINRFDLLTILNQRDLIAKDVLKKIITSPNVKTYDVRPTEQFMMGHLPGAMTISILDDEKFGQNLPENHETPVVFYGSNGCLSHAALKKTRGLGYNNVRVYAGGYQDWSATEYVMIDVNWLKQVIEQGEPHVLVDLRPEEEVLNGHITGATNLSISDLESSRSKFPRDKNAQIIFYGPGSGNAATQVISWGYKSVGIIPTSFDGWQAISNLVKRGVAKSTLGSGLATNSQPIVVEILEEQDSLIN